MQAKGAIFMKTRHGFTLIELLVVIAIIGMLLAVLIPALQYAKMQATGIICASNNRALAQGWHLYTEDNDGKLCEGNTYNDQQWLGPPRPENGPLITTNIPVSYEDEVRGYEAGTLWQYLMSPKIYHCPGDNRWNIMARGYRSTSIQGMMNGESNPATTGYAQKMADLIAPGNKYVFIENVDPRGWNMGSWIMANAASDSPSLIDPIAIFHADRSTFGFADGHAEKHGWRAKRLIEWAKAATTDPVLFNNLGGFSFVPNPSDKQEVEDVRWLAAGYIPGAH